MTSLPALPRHGIGLKVSLIFERFHGFFNGSIGFSFIGSPVNYIGTLPTVGFSHRVYRRGFSETIGVYMSFFFNFLVFGFACYGAQQGEVLQYLTRSAQCSV